MKNTKRLKLLNVWLLIVLSLGLTNCKISDVPACKHLKSRLHKNPETGNQELRASPLCWKNIKEMDCLRCKFTKSERVEFVGEEPRNWKDFGFGPKSMSKYIAESILLPAQESYAPMSADLINLCKKTNCDKDITRFKVKMDSIASEEE